MNLETISRKQLSELEYCVTELLGTMRKAKLRTGPLVESLKLLEQELGEVRRERFDKANPEFQTY